MKTRNLISALQKGTVTNEDVVLNIDNSEREFRVTGIDAVPGKKTLKITLIESEVPADSVENQDERAEAEEELNEALEKEAAENRADEDKVEVPTEKKGLLGKVLGK